VFPDDSTNDLSMWTCSHCQEQHCDTFAVCWNCGTDVHGRRDPAFVAAGDEEREADAAGTADATPMRHLPDVAYFALPVYLVLSPVMLVLIAMRQRGDGANVGAVQELAVIAVYAISWLCIAIPLFAQALRIAFYTLLRNAAEPVDGFGVQRFLQLLSLPAHIAIKYRWFTPIYYGAFVLYFMSFGVVLVMQIWAEAGGR
jgi:hypothetical protein